MEMSQLLSLASFCLYALEEFVIILSWAECPPAGDWGEYGGGHAMVTGLVGLSHMLGRCSRLSWAQLPLVSSLTLL